MCEILFIDGDDIFGYGVNITARVKNECEPGGVCLSEDATGRFAASVLNFKTAKVLGLDAMPTP
jgi:class 3 adenylate cyclase